MKNNDLMEKIVSLAKRRGFIFPGSEIYGGLSNSWDYGPVGVELKNNIKQLWWKRFVQGRDDMVGIDAALIMNPKVWEASGHVAGFSDLLSECKNCHHRIRVDQFLSAIENKNFNKRAKAILELPKEDFPGHRQKLMDEVQTDIGKLLNEKILCPECNKKDWTSAKPFNLMMAVRLGSTTDDAHIAYFRPETAQAMFVDFKNVLNTSRKTIPFGIAQVGKAFRNEITPGNFIFRTREFEQMEIEYFINPKDDWNKHFEYWLNEMKEWLKEIGVTKNLEYVEISEEDRAHYSKRTVDVEYKYPFGQKELYGLAYRADFDLQNHQKASGEKLEYTDPHTNEKFVPHVIEPTWGVDRTVLVVLLESYREEGEGKNKRVYLALPPKLAPYKVAVFPLMGNKPELKEKARSIYKDLQKHFNVAWDDRGNVGKRYYSQDEVGTPFCITVDFDSLEDGTVTVRDRDTKEQPRVRIEELESYLRDNLS